MPTPQATYWILTIRHADFIPYLPIQCNYIRGQLELGEGGFLHWQLIACFKNKVRLRAVVQCFGKHHAEPTKSRAAMDYVWKEDTAVAGTRFELGTLPINKSSRTDWERVRTLAREGQLEEIPADIYVRCYNQLKRISSDHSKPFAVERKVVCLWGTTGSGKSRRAWEEAGLDAYPKDPRTKFWEGYRGGENVVIDEFRGGIDISHLLRWLDRYPVIVEVKGGSEVLRANKVWITSNLHPEQWYPDLDQVTKQALLRRMDIFEMN